MLESVLVSRTVHPLLARATLLQPVQRQSASTLNPGKRTLTQDLPVQRRSSTESSDLLNRRPDEVALEGTGGTGGPLPHLDRIQASFGNHDVSHVRAHADGAAQKASRTLGSKAYAIGDRVAFGEPPDLHTAAHEAAHVVQQRDGVQLEGGIDQPGDAYERHADAVADRVVAGQSAAPMLDKFAGRGIGGRNVQRTTKDVAAPKGGINQSGFIDNSEGANIRSGPAESGGEPVRDKPLPPATQVFASGTHPDAPHWWYVTAFVDGTMVRGYVQDFRIVTDLPEPMAKLYEVKSNDTVEKLAVREFKSAVRDGHDLRYYENVLLKVSRDKGRGGITGSYQDPGVLGGGSNNVQLVAGHRIWLVSPAYAHALEGVVPDGSLTNGMYAKVKRFVQHLVDIIKSVTEAPGHLDEVAADYAQAIRDHMVEIVGIVAGFIMAEAASAFLAATPTGVGQIAAVIIQLALAAFGAAGMAQAGIEALKHASSWLSLAWTAKGDDKQITLASKEFIKMLVSIAMAALAYLGVKGNMGKAVTIANSMQTPMAPALAIAGGGSRVEARSGVAIGGTGTAGPIGTAGAMMVKHESDGGGSSETAKEPTKSNATRPTEPTAVGTEPSVEVPQGVTPEQFKAVSDRVRQATAKYGDDVSVQGSRARGTARPDSDLDIAIRVDEKRFQQILEESFGKPNPGSAKERTMLHAGRTGKIQRGELGLSALGRQIEQLTGIQVDISVVRIGGPFDSPPFIPLK